MTTFTHEQLFFMLDKRIEEVAAVLGCKTTSIGKITNAGYDSWLYEICEKTVRRQYATKAKDFDKYDYIVAIRTLDNRRFELQGLTNLLA